MRLTAELYGVISFLEIDGAIRIVDLYISQGNTSDSPYPSAVNFLVAMNTLTGVIIDSVRVIDFTGYNKGHYGTINNS